MSTLTHISKHHTHVHTHTHSLSLMNECPTDLTVILCISVAGNFAETAPVSASVDVYN